MDGEFYEAVKVSFHHGFAVVCEGIRRRQNRNILRARFRLREPHCGDAGIGKDRQHFQAVVHLLKRFCCAGKLADDVAGGDFTLLDG